MKNYTLIIHGGAGLVFNHDKYKDSMQKVLDVGDSMLSQGQSSLDVVECCVRMLEDDPLYNAGYGSVLTSEGNVEMDAAIMDGANLSNGAVAAITNVRHPISVARAVMEKTNHVFLVAKGAQDFINTLDNIEKCNQDDLIIDYRREQLKEAVAKNEVRLDHSSLDSKERKFSTVGAVALDTSGNLAAATSTGGIVNKKFGRVGDTPIIGAGTIADNNSCAVSCTGFGEQFIKISVAKRVADYIELLGMNAQSAANKVRDELVQKVGGLGGFIVIDKNGNIGVSHSSPCILFATSKNGIKNIGVNSQDLLKV